MTKQADISRFHRTLLNKITDTEDRSKVGERAERESKVEERSSGSGEEDKSTEDQQRNQSSESRLSSGGENSVESPVESTVDDKPETRGGEEAPPPSEGGERRESRPSTADSDVGVSVAEDTEATSLFPPTVDKEKRRKIAATKRSNEESLQSAKDRYLARKKAKLTAPIVSDD